MSKKGPILLIDDDPDDLQIAELIINDLGIKNPLIKFTSAMDALEYLIQPETEPPFIILSDINLHRMTGVELKNAIDKNEELQKKCIPFIYYSTAGQPGWVAKAFESGGQGFFVKEYSIENITRCFKVIFDYWQTSQHPDK